MNDLDAGGHLNTDKVITALLQYRNTPLQEVGHSPAKLLYGRFLQDHLPSAKELNLIRPEWLSVAHDREVALAKWNVRNIEAYNARRATGPLAPLHIGDIVSVQKQTGAHPKSWDKTGIIRKTPPHSHSTLYSSMDLVAWLCATASFCARYSQCVLWPLIHTPYLLPPHDNTPIAHALPPTSPAPGFRVSDHIPPSPSQQRPARTSYGQCVNPATPHTIPFVA